MLLEPGTGQAPLLVVVDEASNLLLGLEEALREVQD